MPDDVRPEDVLRSRRIRAIDLIRQLQELYSNGEAGFSDYGQLQARFNAVKALAKNDTEAFVTLEEVDSLVRKEQERSRTESEKAADKYQKELAEADPFYGLVETACLEIYGSKPVFHEEFTAENERSYTEEQFKQLKAFDLDRLNSGFSEDEYAALVHLGTADPDRCSGILEHGGVFYIVYQNENLIFDNAASAGPAHMGHDKVTLADGREVIAPRTNTGNVFDILVEPARQDAKKALEAYGKEDKAPLAKFIAKGINSQIENFSVFPGDEGKINSNTVSRLKLVLKILPILERDPDLMEMARFAGLKPEYVDQLRGLDTYVGIRLAGAEAEKRLREMGEGKRKLNDFEREQCALAVLRKRAVTEDAERSRYIFEHSADYQKIEDWLDELQDHPLETFNSGNEAVNQRLQTKHTNSVIHGATERARKTPEIISILGMKGPGVLEGITARNAQLYSKLFTSEGKDLIEAVNKAADVTVSHDGKSLKENPPEPIRTTAREIYNQLTEDYNRRRISYALYDARIQTMRELTKRNPEAFIDLATIDRGIMDAPKRHAKQLEESLKALDAEAALDNDLKNRLDNVMGIYSSEPRSDRRSIGAGYTQEQFDKIKKISLEGMNIGGQPVSPDEFAVISIVAALDPQIGGKWVESHGFMSEVPEQERSYKVTMRNHTHYTTDIDIGHGARAKTGNWISLVVPDARSKAEEALRAYSAQPPEKEMLASLIGHGINTIASTLSFGDDNIMAISKEMLGEAVLMTKLLPVLDRDPDLKEMAMNKYGLKAEQIKDLQGCEAAFRVQRTAELAQKKLRQAAESGKSLSRSEKEVCVEAILRGRLLAAECKEYSRNKSNENEKKAQALVNDLFKYQTEENELKEKYPKGSQEQKELAQKISKIQEDIYEIQIGSVGLPPLFRDMADKGPELLGQRLAERMPGKAALLAMSDKDLYKLLDENTRRDLINDKAYSELKPGVWVQDEEAKKALQEHQARQPQKQDSIKTL